ncbi:MAG: flavodoxin family protein [Phycisphaerales bacterium]|nr:MAG: flavodoxin family protein [Phycisphaerales bacterium]
MSKILAVVGSPRKDGNTHILVSKIAEGARQRGAGVDELLLGELKIKECDGCHRCWQGKECGKRDDMRHIYPKIGDSDAIIFGTPVYWYGPTGLMKMFLDRFVYFNCPENREKVRGKRAVIAVAFEEESIETAGLIVDMFEKSLAYLEMELAGKVLVPGVSDKGDILQKPERLEEAFELGQGLV